MKLSEISNFKIDSYLSKYPDYGGVYSCLHLPPIQEKVYIVNIDMKPNGSGTHWVLVNNLEPERIIYFDPFGLPSNIPTDKWLKTSNKPIYYSNVDYQNVDSDACGYFCIFVAEKLLQGHSMKMNDIIKKFTSDTLENEEKLENHFIV